MKFIIDVLPEASEKIEAQVQFLKGGQEVESRTILLGTPPKPKDGLPTLEPPKIK